MTVSDIQDVVAAGNLPLDTTGIYIVLASADVTDIYPDGASFTTFCLIWCDVAAGNQATLSTPSSASL